MSRGPEPPVPGPLLFARFAYPPNELGLCGPDAHRELLERADASVEDGDLRRLAMAFEGAWPYLELIAHEHGIADPLDARVVEAYWIGNPFLRDVGIGAVGDSLEQRFRRAVSTRWPHLVELALAGARPHHNFHVFCVYPWVGLLRTGATDHALHVLERCRIRPGRVLQVQGPEALVRTRPLTWDGARLGLGPPRVDPARVGDAGFHLDRRIACGDVVALHWDWACARLDERQARALRAETARQLAFVNALTLPAPAVVIG